MLKSSSKPKNPIGRSATGKTKPLEDSDSDTSLGKYGLDNDPTFSDSTSSSTTSQSSPLSALEPKKTFLKKANAKKDSLKFEDEIKSKTFDDPVPSETRRPSNPLAKPEIRFSLVDDCLGNTAPEEPKKDETPFSTMKFGSDTLDEEQEKEEFLRRFEQKNVNPDYGRLNQELDFDLSPPRPVLDQSKVLESFDGKPHQISTPLHHQPTLDRVQESLSNILDQELEDEKRTLNESQPLKHVTIAEPAAVRPTMSTEDLNRTGKTTSDFQSTKSDTTKDFTRLHKAYEQVITVGPTKRVEPKKKPLSKGITTTPSPRKTTSVVTRPKTAPTPKPTVESVDPNLIEQLKEEKDSLMRRIQSIEEKHQEQLRELREENFALKAKISHVDVKREALTGEQREVHELEKLISVTQGENEKLYKQIRELEQQMKQMQKSMFEENEKLRRELLQSQIPSDEHGKALPPSSNVQIHSLLNENHQLKIELNDLKKELEQRSKFSTDERKVKDLERQVKELELINRRHQQSSTSQISFVQHRSDDRAELELRWRKSEECLRERDLHIEKLVRQISDLQEKFSSTKVNSSQGTPSESQQRTKFFHEQSQLKKENKMLKEELEKVKRAKPTKSLKRDLETIKYLRTDLERKNDELEKLRALYDAMNVQHKSLLAEREREKSRAAILGTKPYQPDRFSQAVQPIEEVYEENAQLKHLIEKLEEDSRREHLELMQLREDRQAAIHSALREKDDEILRVRQEHKHEIQKILAEVSSKETENRLSDLLKKVQSYETTIEQLQKSLEHANENARELAVRRLREEELKSTIERLERDLHDARNYQTPEMKHFHQLQNQIRQLEQRWNKREQIRKDYATSLIKQQDLEANEDVQKLRAIIQQKNQEIERFHLELDSMLKLLKTLKFQQLLHQS